MKVKRHACNVIRTCSKGEMESSCASAPPARESENIEAARKARERETNASDLFKAPQAAEERETNSPCRRETAENVGTRETACLSHDRDPREIKVVFNHTCSLHTCICAWGT